MFRKFGRNKYADSLYSLYLLLIANLCICSCTSENGLIDNNSKLLNFTVSVPEWKNNDSISNSKTRAMPVSGSSLDKASSFNIIADAYDGKSSYSTIIKDEAVSYTNNMWQTVAPHYWPGTANNTVNFYAYYPTSISSSITHTAGSAPTFSYTVPDKVSDQIDIMTATGNNVSGNTNSSTSLAFNHIFAAVQFSVGSAGMPNGTITGIALNNILYKGTYSLNGTWTQDATSKKTFSQTVSSSTNAITTITSGATTFMMMPQTLGNDASITVTYSNGGTLTKTISGSWETGKIYTYNISKTIPIATFDYTGTVQTYTAPITGIYKLEVWGAQGGTDSSDSITAGKGGYAQGMATLNKNQVLYIYIGGQGGPAASTGTAGYNGGGLGGLYFYGTNLHSGGGGGATHVASISGILSTLSSNKNAIYIVAGGGGGFCHGSSDNDKHYGGYGGGTDGGNSVEPYNTGLISNGATQTTGYQFGKGQDGHVGTNFSASGEGGGGCGGGWYGGTANQTIGTTNCNTGGSGGSGYIGGVSSGSMSNGVRAGNGYARITFVSAN
jgi:hypothetical protein